MTHKKKLIKQFLKSSYYTDVYSFKTPQNSRFLNIERNPNCTIFLHGGEKRNG